MGHGDPQRGAGPWAAVPPPAVVLGFTFTPPSSLPLPSVVPPSEMGVRERPLHPHGPSLPLWAPAGVCVAQRLAGLMCKPAGCSGISVVLNLWPRWVAAAVANTSVWRQAK